MASFLDVGKATASFDEVILKWALNKFKLNFDIYYRKFCESECEFSPTQRTLSFRWWFCQKVILFCILPFASSTGNSSHVCMRVCVTVQTKIVALPCSGTRSRAGRGRSASQRWQRWKRDAIFGWNLTSFFRYRFCKFYTIFSPSHIHTRARTHIQLALLLIFVYFFSLESGLFSVFANKFMFHTEFSKGCSTRPRVAESW